MLRRFRDDEADDEASYGIMGRLALGTMRAGNVQYSLLSCTAAGLGVPMVLRWIGCGWRALACIRACCGMKVQARQHGVDAAVPEGMPRVVS